MDEDEVSEMDEDQVGLVDSSRRDALKKLGVAAAVAWTAPALISETAHAANTPPPPVPCLLCGVLSPIANNNADNGTSGWTYTSDPGGSLTVQTYGAIPAPVPAAASNFFQLLGQPAPGGSESTGTMRQRIFVPSACEGMNVRFTGYYSNGGNSSSTVTSVEFRNLNSILISALTDTRFFSTTLMTAFSRSGTVPVGTRVIDVVFTTSRVATGVSQQALSRIDLVDLRCF
jgi:hypothetical protein